MPHFFIDSLDERLFLIDDEGRDMADEDAAISIALHGLSDMVKSAIAGRVHPHNQALQVRVRDGAGEVVFSASITFERARAGEDKRGE